MENTTTHTPAETNVATPNPLERHLDLTIPMADLDQAIDKRVKEIAKTARMQGFRPGKVPLYLVKQNYGAQAYNEGLEGLMDKVWADAVKGSDLRVAGYPNIQPKDSEDKSQLVFTATFEVYPDIKLADASSIEISKPVLEVSSAEMDKTLDVLRKQRVRYEPIERAAASGDRVIIDFTGKKDGEVFEGGEAKDYPVVLGEGRMLPDFEAAIIGLNKGQSKSFDMTFPADYGAKELAGQPVTFEVSVKEVNEAVLPEIDSAFAKSLGVKDGDVEKMRAEIESNLHREVKKRLQARVKDLVMESLLQANSIDVPRVLVEMEIRQLMKDARENMENRMGAKAKDFPMQREWFVDQAKRRVTLGLILSEVIRVNEIKPEAAQVRSAIEDLAQSYENPAEVVRWYYSDRQRLADVEGMVLEDNVVAWILNTAKTTEQQVAFDELMGSKNP